MLGLNKKDGARGSTPLEQKLQVMRDKLSAKAQQGSERLNGDGMDNLLDPKTPQTIADDGEIKASKQALIEQDEALVRPLLKLLGMDYDALIQLNSAAGAVSPYQRAVEANPAVLQNVLQSERPVLAALQVALGFKPYAEFIEKYGQDPQGIKQTMTEEIKAELAAAGQQKEASEKQSPTTPFSQSARQATRTKPAKGNVALKDIFKR